MSRFVGKEVDPVIAPTPDAEPEVAPEVSKARVTFDVPADLHRQYKAWCSINGTNMRKHLTAYIEQAIKGN